MAEICCDVVSGESEASPRYKTSSRAARRRRMEIRRFKFVADVLSPMESDRCKRRKTTEALSLQAECERTVHGSTVVVDPELDDGGGEGEAKEKPDLSSDLTSVLDKSLPKFGVTSICGRRRDMEDAVSIVPSFFRREHQISERFHFFGVYDGHGCSHVAMSCKERLHHLVAEELGIHEDSKEALKRSFSRMDAEVSGGGRNGLVASSCRCELQTPQCDAVGSTAVICVLSPDKIVVANCGDSRALLCRNGKPFPLSSDHKPDRPDELLRIEAAGGRVIYWDGPRVLGVLAMSRAIGDNYLKPFVSSEPEVRLVKRGPEDELLILASDGLWDVVSNETACDIAGMCLQRGRRGAPAGNGESACSNASMLLTKLALARQSTDNISVVAVDLRAAADT